MNTFLGSSSSMVSRWCPTCEHVRPFDGNNAVTKILFAGIFLSLITCGLFAPFAVWAVVTAQEKYWCRECGSPLPAAEENGAGQTGSFQG